MSTVACLHGDQHPSASCGVLYGPTCNKFFSAEGRVRECVLACASVAYLFFWIVECCACLALSRAWGMPYCVLSSANSRVETPDRPADLSASCSAGCISSSLIDNHVLQLCHHLLQLPCIWLQQSWLAVVAFTQWLCCCQLPEPGQRLCCHTVTT